MPVAGRGRRGRSPGPAPAGRARVLEVHRDVARRVAGRALDDRQVDVERGDADARRDPVGVGARGRRRPGGDPSGGSVMQRRSAVGGRRGGRVGRGGWRGLGGDRGVYVSSPAASSVTPTAVSSAGRRRVRTNSNGRPWERKRSARPRVTPRTVRTGTLRAIMWPRLSIVAGLVAGVAVAALVLGGILAFAPEPGAAATPAPRALGLDPRPVPVAVGRRASPTAPRFRRVADCRRLGPRRVGRGACSTSASPRRRSSCPRSAAARSTSRTCAGKPVWVNFMGTYCPPCLDEFPLMNGFAARYADDGLVVMAIDVKEDEGIVAPSPRASRPPSRSASTPTGPPQAPGTRWRCRSTSGSTRTGSSATARSAASGRTSWPRGLQTILPGVDVTP